METQDEGRAALLVQARLDTRGSGVSRTKTDRATSHEVAQSKNAEDSATRVINVLWPSDVVSPIDTIRKRFQVMVHSPPMTLPYNGSMRLLPPENYFILMERYRDANCQVAATVQEICPDDGAFDLILERCKKHLGDLYDRSLYPANRQQFCQAFKIQLSTVPVMDTDAILQKYGSVLGKGAEDVAESVRASMEEVRKTGLDDIRNSVCNALRRMVEVLSADKEKKIFDSMVAGVMDLCSSLPIMNKYIQSPELEQFHQQMSSELSHITAERLRNSDVAQRKEVADKAKALLEKLQQYAA